MSERRVLGVGRHLRLVCDENGWESAERVKASGVVVVVAVLPGEKVLLIEQWRPPVQARVIELPAGLAGDIAGQEDEELAAAARRELIEETGWDAERFERVLTGPSSAGLTSELLTLFRATGLTRVGEGGGEESEEIQVHEVPLAQAEAFLSERLAAGVLVDPKVYGALWFARGAR